MDEACFTDHFLGLQRVEWDRHPVCLELGRGREDVSERAKCKRIIQETLLSLSWLIGPHTAYSIP